MPEPAVTRKTIISPGAELARENGDEVDPLRIPDQGFEHGPLRLELLLARQLFAFGDRSKEDCIVNIGGCDWFAPLNGKKQKVT